MSPNIRGAGLMICAMAAFTFNDACMKSLSGQIPLLQAIFLRGIITTVFIGLFAIVTGAYKVKLSRQDVGLISLRTLAEAAGTFLFLTALFRMPFANLSAILQVLPLTVTLASALVFKEAIGWRRLIAILVGFFGVLLIVKPGAADFSIYSIYALIAVLAVTVRDLASRRLSSNVPSLSVALAAAIGITVLSGVASMGAQWAPVTFSSALKLLGASVFIFGGYLFSVMTMRVGEIGFIAPFRYTGLIVALVLGFVIFDEWPDMLTLLGSAIVVATGVFTLYRERRFDRVTGPVPLRMR